MIDFEVIWLNVTANLITGVMPVYVLERPLPSSAGGQSKGGVFNVAEVAREGRFWVPQVSVLTPDPVWVCTATDRYVRVPVHSHRTTSRSLATIYGLGVQIGLAALASLQQHTSEKTKKVTLILGEDCTDLLDQGVDAFRCYAGLAIQT